MEEARAAIGRALLELLAEGRTVSYGAVAVRAGVSKGLVQHYFPDRTRLVRFAATTLAARLSARLSAVPSVLVLASPAEAPGAAPAEVLSEVLTALLPADEAARLDEAAGRALFALALTDPQTNASYREGRLAINGLIRALVARAAPGRDPDWVQRVSRDLLGTLHEVGTDLLLGDLPVAEARRLLRERATGLSG